MKSNRFLVRYKHDIIGKLKDISSVISPLDDYNDCPSSYFVPFSIVHHSLIKMISTSRGTIKELFVQESVLYVLRELPKNESLKQMNIDGIEIFFENSSEGWNGYLVLETENEYEITFTLGKVIALLPSTRMIFNLNNADLENMLIRLVRS